VGSGPAAEKAAAEIEGRRAERKAKAEATRIENLRYAETVSPLEELCILTNLLVSATLNEQGYFRHDQGAWRRKRRDSNEHKAGDKGSQ